MSRPLVFPLSISELKAWRDVASRGGLGTGLAKRDHIAFNTQELMFLQGDPIILLEPLPFHQDETCIPTRYLAFCEGVVGYVSLADVELDCPLTCLKSVSSAEPPLVTHKSLRPSASAQWPQSDLLKSKSPLPSTTSTPLRTTEREPQRIIHSCHGGGDDEPEPVEVCFAERKKVVRPVHLALEQAQPPGTDSQAQSSFDPPRLRTLSDSLQVTTYSSSSSSSTTTTTNTPSFTSSSLNLSESNCLHQPRSLSYNPTLVSPLPGRRDRSSSLANIQNPMSRLTDLPPSPPKSHKLPLTRTLNLTSSPPTASSFNPENMMNVPEAASPSKTGTPEIQQPITTTILLKPSTADQKQKQMSGVSSKLQHPKLEKMASTTSSKLEKLAASASSKQRSRPPLIISSPKLTLHTNPRMENTTGIPATPHSAFVHPLDVFVVGATVMPMPGPVSPADYQAEQITVKGGSAFELVKPHLLRLDRSDDSGAIVEKGRARLGSGSAGLDEDKRRPGIMERDDHEWYRTRENRWLGLMASATPDKQAKRVRKWMRMGVPQSLRGKVWAYVLGASELSVPGRFEFLMNHERQGFSAVYAAIEADLAAGCISVGEHVLFGDGHAMMVSNLRSLLRAFVHYSSSDLEPGLVSYSTALGTVAGFLLVHSPLEEAFWNLVALVKRRAPSFWAPDGLRSSGIVFEVFDLLLEELDPTLSGYLADHRLNAQIYLPSHFFQLFIKTLPWPTLLRVMDLFISEGEEILHRVGLAMLIAKRSRILKTSSREDIEKILENPEEIGFGEIMGLEKVSKSFERQRRKVEKAKL
ncbi:hypothetical protein CROQUDRAFT_654516 [Cronartium quercuum f. sp. fusiforme G11]|uniref:Rab-GAP TBC domain-containing protein n=1 Tax=Cronartium quercuum f. sp. fusiforme G11 TaxID=708437 RepID=A0A9P6NSF5_9BASI|nr:hypothetical protein CROQUDRAFT_654516 [Cronartium quercuum f. sp. fusiforme G11]